MPLYEYLCQPCGHRFERIQKFSDPPVAECPSCGGPVQKQISSPAIQFKGSGFYITDYARAGKSGESSKTSPGQSASSSSPSESGESSSAGKVDKVDKAATTSDASSPKSSPPTTDSKK